MEKSWAAVAPTTALLARGAPRSEHDQERAVAADTITMHRLAGTFTDQRRGGPLDNEYDRSVIRRGLQRFQSRGLRSIALYLLVSAHSSEASHSSDASTVCSNVPSACDGSGNTFGTWGYLCAPLPYPPCDTNERGAAEGVATCFPGNPSPLTLTLTLTLTPTLTPTLTLTLTLTLTP